MVRCIHDIKYHVESKEWIPIKKKMSSAQLCSAQLELCVSESTVCFSLSCFVLICVFLRTKETKTPQVTRSERQVLSMNNWTLNIELNFLFVNSSSFWLLFSLNDETIICDAKQVVLNNWLILITYHNIVRFNASHYTLQTFTLLPHW